MWIRHRQSTRSRIRYGSGNHQLPCPLLDTGNLLGATGMGNGTVMIHCDQCGVSSPRDVYEFLRCSEVRCHICGAAYSGEALAQAQKCSKVLIVRGKRR